MWASLWSIYDGPSSASEANLKPAGRDRATNADKDNHDHGGGSGRRMEEVPKNNPNGISSSLYRGKANAAGNTTIVRGHIIGEEKSGKTSLIRRLRGENPFQQTGNNERITSDTSRKLMALVPWRLPTDAPFHQRHAIDSNGLVQLYVSEGKSFSFSKNPNAFQKQMSSVVMQPQRGKEFDFAVWMIDPRMDKVLDFVREGLEILFPLATVQDNNCSEVKRTVETSQPLIQHLCILLNFRDLIPAEQNHNTKEASLFESIQLIVDNVIDCRKELYEKLRQIDSFNALPTPTIMVYESSTKNCYGLQNFHSFIALPYLSRKERDLRQLAEQTRKQRSLWERGLMEAKHVEYSEFIERRLWEKKPQNSQINSIERQRLEEEKDMLQHRLERQQQILRTSTEKQAVADNGLVVKNEVEGLGRSSDSTITQPRHQEVKVEQEVANAAVNGNSAQRKVFAKSHPTADVKKPASVVTGHTNLESFFSDDEDEEDEKTEIETCDSSDSSEGNDSDDGDFYIDGAGVRCVHANLPAMSKQSSPNLNVTPRNEEVSTNCEGDKAENDSSVLQGVKTNASDSKDDGKDEIEVEIEIEGTKAGIDNDTTTSLVESPVENPAEHAADTETSISGARNSRVDVVKQSSSDTDVGDMSTACVSPVAGAAVQAKDEVHTPVDSTVAQGKNDGPPATNDGFTEESIVVATADFPSSKQPQRDTDDGSLKPTSVESEIESGICTDEKSNNHDSEQQQKPFNVQLVMDSDEDSIGPPREGHGRLEKRIHTKECDESDEELDNHDSTTAVSLPRQPDTRGKSLTVSSAALAAIEAARIEAEQMMAQSQSDEPQMKREKKSKKKKDKDGKKSDKEGKKKKKKDKRQDTHSLASQN
ncbi:hypothetical protein ACHAWU_006953 [Discostella pseudostelligera]|uniref:Uncharacterized protein n=1 Tax=Discostella pseudostelligera TaxID=259834 RepID=A0ABD3MJP7_9STRA